MSEMQRISLQTLARVLSGRGKFTLSFGKSSATDLRNITIHHFKGEITPGVKANKSECWVALKAACAHESAHIRYTKNGSMEEAYRIGGPKHGKIIGFILNIIEDSRIELCMANEYPGTQMWFRFLNEYIFIKRKEWGTGPDALMSALISYSVVGDIPKPIREQKDVMEYVDRCAPIIDRGRLISSTGGVLKCAVEIFEILKDYLELFRPPDISMPGTKKPKEAPKGPIDPRREPAYAPKKPYKPRKSKEYSSEEFSKDKLEEPPDKTDDETDGETLTRSSPESEEKGFLAKEKGSDSEISSKETRDEKGLPKSKEAEEPEETVETDSEDGAKPENEDDCPAETAKASTEDEEPEDEGLDPSESSLDPPVKPEEPTKDSLGDDPLTGDDFTKDFSEDTHEGFPDKSPEEEGYSEDAISGDDDLTDGFDCDDSSVDSFIPDSDLSGPPIDMSDYVELLDAADKELGSMDEAASRAGKEEVTVTTDINPEDITKELDKDINAGCVFMLENIKPDRRGYEVLVSHVKPHISRTVEEIRKILDYKATVVEKNLRKGKLLMGSIWKLWVKDPRIFGKVSQPNEIPKLAVYLLVDQSGSMRFEKMDQAKKAACLLYEVCEKLNIPVNVTGFTGAAPNSNTVLHYRVASFGETDKKYGIANMEAERENRDGYSIRVSTRELLLRNEEQKILLVLSDGLPAMPYKHYYSPNGDKDTALAVREAEKKGIGVIGLFFGDKSSLPQAQLIYNNLIFVEDIYVLPQLLAKVLKKIIQNM